MAGIKCIDLSEKFGAKYRLQKEADGATWFNTVPEERHWLWEIPCQYGIVYPYGGDLLAAAITSPKIANKMLLLLGTSNDRYSAGEELVIRFHIKNAKSVFSLLKPRTRRQLSPEHKARLVEASRKYRFTVLNTKI